MRSVLALSLTGALLLDIVNAAASSTTSKKAKMTTTTRAKAAAQSSTTAAAAAAAAAKATSATAAAAAAAAATTAPTGTAPAAATSTHAECAPYGYDPVNSMLPSFPSIWKTADMSKASADDLAIYNSILPGIPNIAPRGNRAGNFKNVSYPSSDPDCWWTENKCTTPKLAGLLPDITNCNEPNTWGFTLDDGPNCSHNAYYDYLQSINQKATLFYIGSNVLDWPLEAQRGLSDGHEICSHTWSHPYMTAMTNEQAFAELYYSKKAIKDVLGITVQCWRPPYGDVDDRIRYIAQALEMRTVGWSDDTFDYMYSTIGVPAVDKNYQTLLNNAAAGKYATGGIIVLSHELDAETMQLSQQYLPQIQKAFTGGVMPVGTCMNTTKPYLENDVYPDYAQWVAGTRSISVAAPTALGNVPVALAAATTLAASTITPANAAATSVTVVGSSGASTPASTADAKSDANSLIVRSASTVVALVVAFAFVL